MILRGLITSGFPIPTTSLVHYHKSKLPHCHFRLRGINYTATSEIGILYVWGGLAQMKSKKGIHFVMKSESYVFADLRRKAISLTGHPVISEHLQGVTESGPE